MSIALGDQVIVYSSRHEVNSITVKAGAQLHSRYGHFKHDDMVDILFGSKFASANGRGFVHLLRPTPELWTLALPHRTQILYLPDIAFITSFLDIKAGTGSGSFSHSLARTVGEQGRVHSFEYHEERFEKALAEFRDHGLGSIIALKHSNVYKDGFALENQVDAGKLLIRRGPVWHPVFLDLPAPWEALGHAKKALKKTRQSRICCFSPCIEQVLKTVTALSEHGFSDITMYETLTRTHEPAVSLVPNVSEAIKRIQDVEIKKEHRRTMQISDALKRKAAKRKADELDCEPDRDVPAGRNHDHTDSTRTGMAPSIGLAPQGDQSDYASDTVPKHGVEPTSESVAEGAHASDTVPKPSRIYVADNSKKPAQRGNREYAFKPSALTRGHTSYLTFATLMPEVVPAPSVHSSA
ncbi:BZ3500_MvSof-1268-A1-R1_Chr3-2g06265 [Microbotryum saponariae]|uniref:tRNA (adenine(58)-N(1))-methyltransferase catalytic subunit TRM61 n=1 Tax=Microbotryum saponariae TaxID=289078 RepID=A0A2X0LGJ2_9BASI|nr:BZ3500_MvSof-1268-A1-R1_Chr3-2g06265 [Microbotryum saponariae]SDA04230.1 BZ3501_MvSof-1269-A2-R1_Chr3-2g05956 [Microbotryum saponariae]